MNNSIQQGREISNFKTIAISIGQAQNVNSNGIKPRYIVIGVKNAKSIWTSKRQNLMIFEDDVDPVIFDILGKYAHPSAIHQGGLDVDLVAFKNSTEFANDREAMSQLLEFPGGCFETYEFAKGPCYANDINGKMTTDKQGRPVIKSSIAVFVQIDHVKTRPDGSMETVYIEPYSLNTQGQRYESRFFINPVEGTSTQQQDTFDPTSMIGGAAPTQTAPVTGQQPITQPGIQQGQPGVQTPPVAGATAPVM